MQRLRSFAVITLSLLTLGAVLLANDAVAQQKSLQEQLVGTWMLVSADIMRNDGSKVEVFGPNPRGTLIYTSDGHFVTVQMRSDLPKLASNRRDQGTPEEYKAVMQGSLAFFGTYAVNEAEKTSPSRSRAVRSRILLAGASRNALSTPSRQTS
jgi:hypothetical protein